MKFIFNLITLLVFASFLTGAGVNQVTEDKLLLGKPGSSDNRIIEFRDTGLQIRENKATGQVEFSNDGSNFQAIGSGGGGAGGINLLSDANGDFEQSPLTNDYSVSGSATLNAETTDPMFGDQSAIIDFSATGEDFQSTAVTIEKGFIGGSCQHELFYKWPSGNKGDIELVVYDTGSEVTSVELEATSGDKRKVAQLFFDCPDSFGDTLQYRLESTADAAAITIDNGFLGTGKNTVQISQATQHGTLKVPGTTDCEWQTTSGSFASFAADNDCPSYVGTGFLEEPSTKIPAANATTLTPGKYKIDVNGQFETIDVDSSGDTSCNFRLSGSSLGIIDGGKGYQRTTDGDVSAINELTGYFTVPSGTTLSDEVIEIEARGADTCEIDTTVADERELTFQLYKYPLNSAEAITLETSGGEFTAHHDSDCDWSTSSNTFVNPTDSTCTFSSERSGGILSVSSTDSGGDNTPGIDIESNSNQGINLCVSGQLSVDVDNSFAILQLVNSGTSEVFGAASFRATGSNPRAPFSFCSPVDLQSGQNEFDLELRGDGSNNARIITAERTLTWSGFVKDNQFPTPKFTDLQNSLSERLASGSGSQDIICRIRQTSPGGAAFDSPDGCFSSGARSSTGEYNYDLVNGYFESNADLTCWVTSTSGPSKCGHEEGGVINESDTSIQVRCRSDSGDTDAAWNAICFGPKG